MSGISVSQEEQIKDLIAQGQRVAAVKLYREMAGVGLREAKDVVDAIDVQMRGEIHTSLPSTPTVSNDPFAEDKRRNRRFLGFSLAILLIGALIFSLLTNNGF